MTVARTFGKHSLCWFCKKAASSMRKSCSWAQFQVPVDGWNIDQKLSAAGRTNVITCPEFEADDCIVDAVTYCLMTELDENKYYKTLARQFANLDYDSIRKESIDFITGKCRHALSMNYITPCNKPPELVILS